MRLVWWERGPWKRLTVAFSVATLIGLIVHEFIDLSLRWCIPIGLFFAVQLQKNAVI